MNAHPERNNKFAHAVLEEDPIGWNDVYFLLKTSALCGLIAYQGFTEEVQRYHVKMNSSPAVLVQEDLPWSDCYPLEVFPDHEYQDPVVEFVMTQVPQLDPLEDTYRIYESFLDKHSRINSYGTVFTYVVPDVDLDGRVCGITIGKNGSLLLEKGAMYDSYRSDNP